MGRIARSVLAGFAVALWMLLMDRVFDHEWPSLSALGWVIYVGGFVVIFVGGTIIESAVKRRHRRKEQLVSGA